MSAVHNMYFVSGQNRALSSMRGEPCQVCNNTHSVPLNDKCRHAW